MKVVILKLGFSLAFLLCDQGIVMVDTGINVNKQKYLREFDRAGINPNDINLLVITHAHIDHYAGADVIKELTDAPILCHKNAAKYLYSGRNNIIRPQDKFAEKALEVISGCLPEQVTPIKPDILIDKELSLTSFGIHGEIIMSPGHTDCSISVVLDSGEAITGDIFVPDFFTGKPCLSYFNTDYDKLIVSAKKLLSCSNVFYGSHGMTFSKKDVLSLLAD